MRFAHRIDQIVTRWLTRPQSNAAGRLSLFRIVYGLFYLWTTSYHTRYEMWYGGVDRLDWSPIVTFRWLIPTPPDVQLLQVLSFILVFSLALLTLGFLTRWATLSVLITGTILVGIQYSIAGKIDHSNTFLVSYIPAIMLFSRWNALYSVDALLGRDSATSASDSSWEYAWPLRAILLLLSLMFCGSAYLKIMGGQWLTDTQLMSRVLLTHNVVAITRSTPPNPLNPLIAGLPVVPQILQYSGLLFELTFPLALLNDRFRNFYVATAVVFHSFNRYFLTVSATPLLIVYLAFVDWQMLYKRLKLSKLNLQIGQHLSRPALIILSIMIAVLTTIIWNGTNPLGYIFHGPTMWYLAAIMGLVFMVRYAILIFRQDVVTRFRRLAV